MDSQRLELKRYDWVVYVFYNPNRSDADDIMECLYNLGCNSKVARRAYDNLTSGETNTGLTFSKNRKTCIVMGRATDKQNFAHTYIHEIFHCAIHIANEYNISPQEEKVAYIAGDLGAATLPYASKFLCECCSKKIDYERE